MTTPYLIAIPTYNRVNEIQHKTLATLKRYNIDPSVIHLFVANEEQKQLYEANIPKDLYGSIIVGKLGISAQRNFIRYFFDEGEYIISMDDDITDVVFSVHMQPFQSIKTLHGLFIDAYDALLAKNLYIWGLYPALNKFYMYKRITTDLRFIMGTMHGYINRHTSDLDLNENIIYKEDYENTILYYIKDGGVMRFNYIYPKQKFYAPGGLGDTRDTTGDIEYILNKYPQYVWIKKRKLTRVPEIKLKLIKQRI